MCVCVCVCVVVVVVISFRTERLNPITIETSHGDRAKLHFSDRKMNSGFFFIYCQITSFYNLTLTLELISVCVCLQYMCVCVCSSLCDFAYVYICMFAHILHTVVWFNILMFLLQY